MIQHVADERAEFLNQGFTVPRFGHGFQKCRRVYARNSFGRDVHHGFVLRLFTIERHVGQPFLADSL
jgi:hypothetical protein